MTLLVRPRAWWYNKVPLSVLTGLLLVVRHRFTLVTVLSLVGLVLIVGSVANYAYALNELYDRDEDRRGARLNAAESYDPRTMWLVIVASAAMALFLSMAVCGLTGFILTGAELVIPLAYSVPPLRTKNRGWLGVLCDACAAHVYPAMLAIAIVCHQKLRAPAPFLVITYGIWALMTGLRGILSHQLQSEAHDRGAGLLTVVHRFGHRGVASFVTFAILPIEVAAFVALVVQCNVTGIFALISALFLLYELLKFTLNAFPAVVFDRRGGHYLPFVDEGGYKVWGPLALAIDAATTDIMFLTLVPLYLAFFRPRIVGEWQQIRDTGKMVRTRTRGFAAGFFG